LGSPPPWSCSAGWDGLAEASGETSQGCTYGILVFIEKLIISFSSSFSVLEENNETTCFDPADSLTFPDICCQQFSLEQTVFAFFEKYLFCIVCCWSEHSLETIKCHSLREISCEWLLC
jgi:hypothetical protein